MEGILTIGEFTIISTYFSMILGAIRYFFGLGKSIQEMQHLMYVLFLFLMNMTVKIRPVCRTG